MVWWNFFKYPPDPSELFKSYNRLFRDFQKPHLILPLLSKALPDLSELFNSSTRCVKSTETGVTSALI
jgi:hypothetical protein